MRRLGLFICTLGLVFTSARAVADSSSSFNFRFSPLGALVGAYNVNMDFVVAPEWTVGPELSYMAIRLEKPSGFTSDVELSGFGGGVRGTWFKNGVFTDGLYVGPHLLYRTASAKTKDSAGKEITGTANGILAGAILGYGWFWDSFNMMLGIGGDIGIGNTKVEVKDSSGTTSTSQNLGGLTGEFSLGWTF